MLAGELALAVWYGQCIRTGLRAYSSPVLAPRPSEVIAQVTEKSGRSDKATSITKASDFRPWEPILEEIAGAAPVSSDKVVFLSHKEMKQKHGALVAAGYDMVEDRILMHDPSLVLPVGWTKWQTKAMLHLCHLEHEDSPCQYPPLYIWLHEQGHHYDRHPYWIITKWGPLVAEAEADAFALYVAEHVAKNYDAVVGSTLARFIQLGLHPQDDQREALGSLAASGFKSFGELWYFIYSNEPHVVFERIRSNKSRLDEGWQAFYAIINKL